MLEGFGKGEAGRLVVYLVMRRDDEQSNKTIVLSGKEMQLHGAWSGSVNSQEDYLVMISVVSKFIGEYKNNLGAI
jgi:hypothetical protein